jgi:hypothetical protein
MLQGFKIKLAQVSALSEHDNQGAIDFNNFLHEDFN